MNRRDRADAVGREELALVQHDPEHALQPLAIENRQQPAFAAPSRLHARDVVRQIGAVLHEPAEPPAETVHPIELLGLDASVPRRSGISPTSDRTRSGLRSSAVCNTS